MSEADLRASAAVLTGTTANDWPMRAHGSGVADAATIDLSTPWDASNMQWAGVFTWQGAGEFSAIIDVLDAANVVKTPANTITWHADRSTGGKLYVALINPSTVTPPAIGGDAGWKIRLRVSPVLGPYAVPWEAGIFERVPYDPPPPPPDPAQPLGPCPERPPWPYLTPSISGYQGPVGVMRGARR